MLAKARPLQHSAYNIIGRITCQLLARAWYMVCTLVALTTCIGYNLVQQYQYYGCGFQFHFVCFCLMTPCCDFPNICA